MPSTKRIEVFLSYSRDGEAHQEWVGRLADRLEQESDLHLVLDAYDVYGGTDLPHFMERCRSCERVIVVVTPRFVEKADRREGGVGYESGIAASELASGPGTDKFIPVLREGSRLPAFLGGKTYVDIRDDAAFDDRVQELLDAIRRRPRRPRPAKRADIAGSASPTIEELNRLLRERTTDGHRGEVNACQQCGSADLEIFHDADVDQEWADGDVHSSLNYFIDGVECRECGWRRTELSDRHGAVFERQVLEGSRGRSS